MKKLFSIIICIALGLCTSSVMAETLYVTDRILLGVHQQANEDSPLITSITSGTSTTVLEVADSFTKVKLADGTEGWISSNYLKKEKPATAEVDAVYAQLQQVQEANKKLTENLNKVERELQVRRDEVSNYKTTLKEVRKQIKEKTSPAGQAVIDDTALQEAQTQITSLQEQLSKLEQEKAETQNKINKDPEVASLEALKTSNQAMKVRIEAALANLKGEQVPTAAELAAIRPSFPFWYWLLLVALFIAGAGGGYAWFDRQTRKKHGGFRI